VGSVYWTVRNGQRWVAFTARYEMSVQVKQFTFLMVVRLSSGRKYKYVNEKCTVEKAFSMAHFFIMYLYFPPGDGRTIETRPREIIVKNV
jgi:hypothetical protein